MTRHKNLFWVAGMMKSATTWAMNALTSFSDMDTPPIKEISYFYEAELKYNSEYIIEKDMLSKNAVLIREYRLEEEVVDQIRDMRQVQLEKLDHAKNIQLIPELTELGIDEYINFLNTTCHSEYPFDCSVENAILSPHTLERINGQIDNFKIIFILRNPVDRIISQANMMFRSAEDHTIWYSDYENFIFAYNPHNDYIHILENFKKVLREDQIHIRFYDEISEDPESFVISCLDFLQLNYSSQQVKDLSIKFGQVRYAQTNSIPINSGIKARLYKMYAEQIEYCLKQHPESKYPKKWKERMQLALPSQVV